GFQPGGQFSRTGGKYRVCKRNKSRCAPGGNGTQTPGQRTFRLYRKKSGKLNAALIVPDGRSVGGQQAGHQRYSTHRGVVVIFGLHCIAAELSEQKGDG